MIKIISNDESFIDSMERHFRNDSPYFNPDNLYIIDYNAIVTDDLLAMQSRTIAKNRNNVAIIVSMEDRAVLSNYLEFAGYMSFANVEHVSIYSLVEIPEKYNYILAGKKQEDTLVAIQYTLRIKQEVVTQLKHEKLNAESDESMMELWLELAKSYGFKGDFEEISKQLESWTPAKDGAYKGKTLSGIFIDAYETLFDENWAINENVLHRVEGMAAEFEKRVFVLSDRDEDTLKQKLQSNKIVWGILSKYEIRGSILEICIDNLTEKELAKEYKIICQTFIPVQALVE